MDRDSLDVGDLSEPVATTEKDRGLQITVTIPPSIETHLSPDGAKGLEEAGQNFLHETLVEARRLAATESNDLGFTITAKHISQAEIVQKRRSQTKRDKWDHLQSILQNLGWAGVGAAIGTFSSNLQLAFGLLLGFGALLLFARGRS